MNKKAGLLSGITLAGGIIGILFLLNGAVLTYETIKYPDWASAATSSAVAVTATVLEDISCETNTAFTAFGTFAVATITTSSPNASTTMSCGNVAGGCTLYVRDAGNGVNGGLATTSPAYLIPSPNAAFSASTTLVTSQEGYGIRATTTTAGSGATLILGPQYVSHTGENDVGRLAVTNTRIAHTTSTTSAREIVVTHKAVVISSTQAGVYEDTITYECTAT